MLRRNEARHPETKLRLHSTMPGKSANPSWRDMEISSAKHKRCQKSKILPQKPKIRNPNSLCGFGIWRGQAGSGGDGHVSKPSQNQHLAGRLPKGARLDFTDGPPKPSRFAEETFSRILLEIRDMEPGGRFPALRQRHKLACNRGLKDTHIYACLLFEHA